MHVAVTGAGIVSAIGIGKQEVLESLLSQKTGIGQMQYLQSEHTELPVGEVKCSNAEMKQQLGIPSSQVVSRTVLMGALAVRQALAEANLSVGSRRIALIAGTTVGGMDVTERYFLQLKDDDSLLYLLDKHDCGSSTVEIA